MITKGGRFAPECQGLYWVFSNLPFGPVIVGIGRTMKLSCGSHNGVLRDSPFIITHGRFIPTTGVTTNDFVEFLRGFFSGVFAVGVGIVASHDSII